MLNQQVSIDEIDRPAPRSTALSPLPARDDAWVVDPDLKARLIRAAAASGLPSPDVVPGAAVLLLPLDLPLASDRKRRAAAPFAIEPFLASRLEGTHVAVGPVVAETTRLCAASDRNDLLDRIAAGREDRAVLPDLCAVPMPTTRAAWAIWCGPYAIYLRMFDGAGCVFAPAAFADLWRAFDRPRLELWHGAPPPGVEVAQHHPALPDLDPAIFDLDLRPIRQTSRAAWRGRLGFAAALGAIAGAAHAAILYTDAHVLEQRAATQRAAVFEAAASYGVRLDFDLPVSVLTAQLAASADPAIRFDPFLTLLTRTGAALSGRTRISFRDLRYEAAAGTLTVLISAPDLGSLQQAETALRSGGLNVSSGAATTSEAGAEMQLILSEGA